ncbi:MAG: class I SAM-dependent methyltransferase [Gammaproteobacteria bacterium]
MTKALNLLLPVLLLTAITATVPTTVAADEIAKLTAAANGHHRSAKNIARNEFRHPVETLAWFGIKDNMTVVEVSPGGGGWYTEILAPYLRDNGKLYVASYDSTAKRAYLRINHKKYLDKLAAMPGIYNRVTVTEFGPPKKSELQPEGQADMVVTFRNVHGWLNADNAEQVFAAIYKVLKPGGILGLVTHRGEPGMTGKKWSKKGYTPEKVVINLAEDAGFELVAKTEINANPKDSKDYPEGVWTLPPAYRLGEQDRDKYSAIGESDRMTMKFVKFAR